VLREFVINTNLKTITVIFVLALPCHVMSCHVTIEDNYIFPVYLIYCYVHCSEY